MRQLPLVLILAFGLSGVAQAQFANRSLGLSVGYLKINTDQPFEWALPLSLEGSLYIENGFDVTLRVPLMLITERVNNRQLVAAGSNVGIRYLFSEESLRPYVGAELAFLYIFRADGGQTWFPGIGALGGFDYFVADTVSVGARGVFDLYVMLNVPPMNSFGASITVAAWF